MISLIRYHEPMLCFDEGFALGKTIQRLLAVKAMTKFVNLAMETATPKAIRIRCLLVTTTFGELPSACDRSACTGEQWGTLELLMCSTTFEKPFTWAALKRSQLIDCWRLPRRRCKVYLFSSVTLGNV